MTAVKSNVLVDYLVERRSTTLDFLWTVGFCLVTALAAQVRIPLPFTPVPLTGQTFGVLLSGAVLGWRRGLGSQVLYLAVGASGLPVFAGGGGVAYLLGPTAGYLWSFPVAAGALGWLVERGASRRAWKMALAMFASSLLILVTGTVWLGSVTGLGLHRQWWAGFYPFLAGDLLKIALVGLALPRVLRYYQNRPHPGAPSR
jgi:biotin transport system substrate-specific component